jgi:30S ribosomal protein S31
MGLVSFSRRDPRLDVHLTNVGWIVSYASFTANEKTEDAARRDRRDARGNRIMGKGDRRSKRGKTFRGTFGKKRLKAETVKKAKAAAAAAGTVAAEPAPAQA